MEHWKRRSQSGVQPRYCRRSPGAYSTRDRITESGKSQVQKVRVWDPNRVREPSPPSIIVATDRRRLTSHAPRGQSGWCLRFKAFVVKRRMYIFQAVAAGQSGPYCVLADHARLPDARCLSRNDEINSMVTMSKSAVSYRAWISLRLDQSLKRAEKVWRGSHERLSGDLLLHHA